MKISFYGDISLFKIDTNHFQFCPSLLKLFNASDINVGNLECPITNSTKEEEQQPLRMHASLNSLNLIKPFQIVSLSNNHIRDFQEEGIQDTLTALKEFNIKFFGIGKTQEEALKPLLIEKDGFKIAFLGITRFANVIENKRLGTAKDSSFLLLKKIKKLKKDGFFVIPFFHWGYEYVRIPSPRERKIAHKCINAGADIIIGSHPHIYQGIEEYRGKKIIYSLGNFIFHSSVFEGLSPITNDPRLKESFVYVIDITKDLTYKSYINGYKTDNHNVTLYDAKENSILLQNINEVSKILSNTYLKYMHAYYMQTYEISRQNIKIRRTFQSFEKLSLRQKLKIFKTANFQDIKNRIFALLLFVIKKF